MEEALCSADEPLWCAPRTEPDVLSSSTTGPTISTSPELPARSGPPSGAPFAGLYDDDGIPPMLRRPDDGIPPMLRRPDDGIPPMLRRPDESAAEPAHTRRPSHSSEEHERVWTEENEHGLETVERIATGFEVTAEVGEAVTGHHVPVVGAVGDAVALAHGYSEGVGGLVDTATGHPGRGVPHMIAGATDVASHGLALGAAMTGGEAGVVPEIIDGAGNVAEGAAEIVDGAAMTARGDTGHGVPRMADGAVDATVGAAGMGVLGGEAASLVRGPAGLVLGGAVAMEREGRGLVERDETLGTVEAEDGSTRGLNAYEFGVANGTDAYHGMHDYLAGDAEEGSAREIMAEVGGGAAGGLVGLGAGIVGVGGELVASARERSSMFDSAWSWMME